MSTHEIKKTKNYEIFKKHRLNRPVSDSHVNHLVEAIQEKNLLDVNPLLVNLDMAVLSGQHRLEAAKRLGLDIYYIQSDFPDSIILMTNQMQKPTTLSEAITFYCIKEGKKDYILLNQYIKQTELSPKALLSLLFGSISRKMNTVLSKGNFIFPNDVSNFDSLLDIIVKFKEFCREKRIAPLFMFNGSSFTTALRNVALLPNFDETLFFEKLANRWFELKPQPNAESWTKLLLGIYNWKNREPLSIPQDY